jgi:hypothetical protein
MLQVTVPNQGAAFTFDWPDPVVLRFPPDALRVVAPAGVVESEDPSLAEEPVV